MEINKQSLKNEQSQQAGDNSNLQQVGVINNYTIQFDEGKCREVCKSYFEMAQQNMAFAMELAQKREMAFEDAVVNRLQKVENSMEAFRDPAFLKSLKKAQEVAICTDEKSEYDLLSELLVNRFEVRSEKQQSLYVNKAIEIVDEIPEDALMGLTMMHVFAGTSICSTDHYYVRWMLAHWYQQILTGGRLPEGPNGWKRSTCCRWAGCRIRRIL